jgi:hypothetical protein
MSVTPYFFVVESLDPTFARLLLRQQYAGDHRVLAARRCSFVLC